ncbi:MAG: hypothetical protein D9C04_01555 [Nitrosopumilus sp. B06]|nr:MAG: hypothetical protein D9C04_01555 [Nitrosopumilus sp. B06]
MSLNAVVDIRLFSDTASRPHLILADDGNQYVVKFAQNADLPSIVAEYVCGMLAAKFNLRVLDPIVIMLDADFIRNSVLLRDREIQAGPHLGTKMINTVFNLNGNTSKKIYPKKIINRDQVPNMISFDIFVNNKDRNPGNSILVPVNDDKFEYVLLDHGECFGGSNWDGDIAKKMKYELSEIHWDTRLITGVGEFIIPMQEMTQISSRDVQQIIDSMPRAWVWDDKSTQSLILALSNRDMKNMLLCIENNKSMFPRWI